MKIILNEGHINTVCLLEAMKEGFSIETLKSLPSFAKKRAYCKQMLGNSIGKGSSREVYQIDDEKILKLAMNNKGIAQNEVEADWGLQNYGVVPKLFDSDDDGLFIIAEYVLPAKEADFQHCFNMNFNDFCRFIAGCCNLYLSKPIRYGLDSKTVTNLCNSNQQLYSFMMYITDYQPPYGDVTAIRNYGLTQRNNQPTIVLLDSGLNNEVWNDFYK